MPSKLTSTHTCKLLCLFFLVSLLYLFDDYVHNYDDVYEMASNKNNGDIAMRHIVKSAVKKIPTNETKRDLTEFALRHVDRIFYNRVPKCGSSATMEVFEHLARLNKFTYISSPDYNNFYLTSAKRSLLAREILSYPARVLYDKHTYYINFGTFNLKHTSYINLIREPVDRRVSMYYFLRYYREQGDPSKLSNRTRSRTQEYDECVRQRDKECVPGEAWQLQFFCGHEATCRDHGPNALALAKDAVERSYLVVGITEEFEAFLQVLEIILPQYFENALRIYRPMQYKLQRQYSTTKKRRVSNSTLEYMKHYLRHEYDFYYFIQQRFYKMAQLLGVSVKASSIS